MQDIEALGYLLVFALSVIWSSMAVSRKSVGFSFLSWLCWTILAILQLGLGFSTLVFGLEWLFFGVSWIFLVLGFALTIKAFTEHRKRSEWEIAEPI